MKNLLLSTIFAITAIASSAAADSWPDLSTAGKKTGGGENDVALLIAVSTYENLENSAQVPGAVENLKAWQHWLKDIRGVSQVYTLTDKEVTTKSMAEKAEVVGQLVKPGGTVWFLFVGHGMPHPQQRTAMLMTHKVDEGDPEHDSVLLGDIVKLLVAKKPARTVLVVDSCFAGGADHGGKSMFAGTQASVAVKKELLNAATSGSIMLSAGSNGQLAGQLPGMERPAYSYLLLGGLMGWADGAAGGKPDGSISVEEATNFAKGAIAYSNKLHQTPEFSPTVEQSTVLAKSAGLAKVDVEGLMTGKKGGGGQKVAVVVECPAGTTLVGEKCLRAAECEAGSTWDGGKCVRKALAVACPAGTSLVGDKCLKSAECEAGSSWDGGKCVRKAVAGAVACPAGTSWNGSACVGQIACPKGSTWDGARCILPVIATAPLPLRAPERTQPTATDGQKEESVVRVDVNGDGKPELFKYFRGDVLVRKEMDVNFDQRIDTVQHFEGRAGAEQVSREEMDTDFDGRTDVWTYFFDGLKVRSEYDMGGDGKPDRSTREYMLRLQTLSAAQRNTFVEIKAGEFDPCGKPISFAAALDGAGVCLKRDRLALLVVESLAAGDTKKAAQTKFLRAAEEAADRGNDDIAVGSVSF